MTIIMLLPLFIGIIVFFIIMIKAWKDLSFFPALGGFLAIFIPGLYVVFKTGDSFIGLGMILFIITLLLTGVLIMMPYKKWDNYFHAGLILGALNILLLIAFANLLLMARILSF